MSILVNDNTRLVVQGITGSEGSLHARLCKAYGTNLVAGVTPGKGGLVVLEDIPVYNTVMEAVKYRGANTSIIFVPAAFAADAILEAIDARLDLIVCITEGIPIHDMMRVKYYLRGKRAQLIGPNCPGIISPKTRTKVGIMPARIFKPGNVGVVSRSGSLTYEVSASLSKSEFGQSTCLGIGGDSIVGTSFVDCLKLFKDDSETEAVVMVGEIGGNAEERAAEFIKREFTKPVVAYVCGLTAPPDKRMGHAGAIISGGAGTARGKMKALAAAGITVAKSIEEVPSKLKELLRRA